MNCPAVENLVSLVSLAAASHPGNYRSVESVNQALRRRVSGRHDVSERVWEDDDGIKDLWSLISGPEDQESRSLIAINVFSDGGRWSG